MARRSGGGGSRSDRKAGRERARRAKRHGLPERREEAPRGPASAGTRRAADTFEADEPASRRSAAGLPGKAKIPTLAKVVGGALLVLAGAYALSRIRDSAPSEALAPEPATLGSASRPTESSPASAPVKDDTPPTPAAEPSLSAAPVVLPAAPLLARPSASLSASPVAARPKSALVPVPATPAPPKTAPPIPGAAEAPRVPPVPNPAPAPAAPDNPY